MTSNSYSTQSTSNKSSNTDDYPTAGHILGVTEGFEAKWSDLYLSYKEKDIQKNQAVQRPLYGKHFLEFLQLILFNPSKEWYHSACSPIMVLITFSHVSRNYVFFAIFSFINIFVHLLALAYLCVNSCRCRDKNK